MVDEYRRNLYFRHTVSALDVSGTDGVTSDVTTSKPNAQDESKATTTHVSDAEIWDQKLVAFMVCAHKAGAPIAIGYKNGSLSYSEAGVKKTFHVPLQHRATARYTVLHANIMLCDKKIAEKNAKKASDT